MKRLNDLEYLRLDKGRAFLYNVVMFFCAIPGFFGGAILKLLRLCKKGVTAIGKEIADIVRTFVR